VLALLHYAGGIGRLVHDTVRYGTVEQPRMYKPKDEFRRAAGRFFVLVNLVRGHMLQNSDALEAALARQHHTVCIAPEHVAMPLDAAIEQLKFHGVKDCSSKIEVWLDMGLLYIGTGHARTVELARPADALVYFVGQPSVLDYLRLHWCQLVSVMVQLPEEGNNAGKPLDTLVRPRLSVLSSGQVRWS
jgi:hypothetical protein